MAGKVAAHLFQGKTVGMAVVWQQTATNHADWLEVGEKVRISKCKRPFTDTWGD